MLAPKFVHLMPLGPAQSAAGGAAPGPGEPAPTAQPEARSGAAEAAPAPGTASAAAEAAARSAREPLRPAARPAQSTSADQVRGRFVEGRRLD